MTTVGHSETSDKLMILPTTSYRVSMICLIHEIHSIDQNEQKISANPSLTNPGIEKSRDVDKT